MHAYVTVESRAHKISQLLQIINPQRMRRVVIVVSCLSVLCVTHNLETESLSLSKQASIQSKSCFIQFKKAEIQQKGQN